MTKGRANDEAVSCKGGGKKRFCSDGLIAQGQMAQGGKNLTGGIGRKDMRRRSCGKGAIIEEQKKKRNKVCTLSKGGFLHPASIIRRKGEGGDTGVFTSKAYACAKERATRRDLHNRGKILP